MILRHKFATLLTIAAIAGIAWYAYPKLFPTPSITSYVVANAATSTIVVSVTGTGQVSASNQLALSPQASGQIIYIGAKDGQTVSKGTLIAEVDPTDAQKKVRDAQASLKSSQLSLAKLQQPATALTLAQTQDALANAKSSLATTYSGSSSDLANTFQDLPSIITGLQDIDFGSETNKSQQWNIDWYNNGATKYDTRAQGLRDNAYSAYNTAKAAYDITFNDYKNTDLSSSDASTTEHLLTEVYNTAQAANNAVKATNALIQFYADQLNTNNLTVPAIATSQINSLASYTSKLSTHSSALFSDTSTIQSDKQTITEKSYALQELQAGADTLDLQSAQLSVQNAQNALQDAKDNLANYFVYAPFSGTIGLSVTPYQQVGSGTTVATLITHDQLAQITLNEVDAATVKTGDQATLTFDAFPDLTIAGSVASIAPVGTVSQGVVSYVVKISFATQDTRIKPGMSVSAQINTQVKTDALAVPGSAVHTSANGESYVLTFDPPLVASSTAAANKGIPSTLIPQQIPITVGINNTTMTEITAGITAGQQVVVRSITSSATVTNSAAVTATSRTGGGSFGGAGAAGSARAIGL